MGLSARRRLLFGDCVDGGWQRLWGVGLIPSGAAYHFSYDPFEIVTAHVWPVLWGAKDVLEFDFILISHRAARGLELKGEPAEVCSGKAAADFVGGGDEDVVELLRCDGHLGVPSAWELGLGFDIVAGWFKVHGCDDDFHGFGVVYAVIQLDKSPWMNGG